MNKCNVIRDLLPLYADKVCSEDSREMVEEHLAKCKECKQELDDYCYNTGIEEISTDVAMKNFKKKMGKKIFKKIVVSVIVSLLVISCSAYILFVPEFTVPYSEGLMTAKIPVDEGIDVWVNMPNYTQVYAVAQSNPEDDSGFDIYLTVTRNLWSMIVPDFDEMNNFWRTNGFIGMSFQASDEMPFKESDTTYFSTAKKITNIYYADYESTHITNRKADFQFAVRNELAETHLIWTSPETE